MSLYSQDIPTELMIRNISRLLLYLCISGCISSCAERYENVNATDLASRDSLSYYFDEENTVTIKVGDRITHRPVSSQVVSTQSGEKYLLLDTGHIYVFDWNSGLLEDSISTEKCGNVNNYSGFAYVNPDSIFVYNYAQKNLYLINDKGDLKKTLSLNKIHKDNHIVLDAEGINRTRIAHINNHIIMSGSVFSSIKDMPAKSCRATAMYDLADSGLKGSLPFPDMYSAYNWGGIYMNEINHCMAQGNMLYSYPISHYVYKYDENLSSCDSIYMGSRYCRSIKSYDGDVISALIDKNEMIRYYVSEHSYADVFYDNEHGRIYRLAYHPNTEWTSDDDMFNRPFSVIVADDKGKILCETRPYCTSDYNWSNAHVTSCGLAVAMYNTDESVITFRCLKTK